MNVALWFGSLSPCVLAASCITAVGWTKTHGGRDATTPGTVSLCGSSASKDSEDLDEVDDGTDTDAPRACRRYFVETSQRSPQTETPGQAMARISINQSNARVHPDASGVAHSGEAASAARLPSPWSGMIRVRHVYLRRSLRAHAVVTRGNKVLRDDFAAVSWTRLPQRSQHGFSRSLARHALQTSFLAQSTHRQKLILTS